MLKNKKMIILLICGLLSACTGSIVNYSSRIPVNLNSKIAVVPFSNYTETPLAGERAMSVTAGVLESRGFCNIVVYQKHDQNNVLLPGISKLVSRRALMQWASSVGARYLVTGSVNEWSYKVGLDGEPVVGVSIQLIELSSKRIAWTSVGSMSGGSRVAVSTVAQRLINNMLDQLFNPGRIHG